MCCSRKSPWNEIQTYFYNRYKPLINNLDEMEAGKQKVQVLEQRKDQTDSQYIKFVDQFKRSETLRRTTTMRISKDKKEKATKGVKTEPLIFVLEGQAVLQYTDKDFKVHEIVKVRAGDVLGLTELLKIEVSFRHLTMSAGNRVLWLYFCRHTGPLSRCRPTWLSAPTLRG